MRFVKLLLILAFAPAFLKAAPPPGIPDGWSDGYVYANGIRIHYYHAVPAPGKPVIVMAHGITDIGLCWTTLTWKLQGDYDVYMVDARGHGLSDPFTTSDDADTMIKDLVEFVRALKLEKPILVGHSMGAATVMRIGAEYPDLAKAIVMLDPRLEPPPTTNSLPGGNSMFGPPEKLVAQNNARFEELVATCHAQSPRWDLVDCQYWALSKKQYHGAYGPEAMKPLIGVRQIGDSLAKITVPALILKADAPPATRKANEAAARVMQHGRLVHIDDSAHNLHHDQLNRTTAVLREFLSSL
jgi:pimeloyl-ACP methyl ester carboxylesterase